MNPTGRTPSSNVRISRVPGSNVRIPHVPGSNVGVSLALAAAAWLAGGCGSHSTTTPVTPAGQQSGSAQVQTGQEKTIENASGVRLSVVSSTVPTDPSGGTGQLVFSIEPSSATGTLPSNCTSAGGAWQLGPEGIHFAGRCRVSVPLPSGSGGGYVLGRLNPATQRWEMMPTALLDGSSPRLSADVLHLSIWQPFYVTTPAIDPRSYGAVHVQNVDATRSVSLCIKSYSLKYPAFDTNFSAEAAGLLLPEAGHNGGISGLLDHLDWYLPQGRYVFEATRSVTHNPLLGSAGPDGWVELDTVVIDEATRFGSPPARTLVLNPSGWTQINTVPLEGPCEGTPDYAFGTGPVQVTLTWDVNADLDLHVTEPSGERINYLHRTSATHGQLDRDRQCSTADLGKPENVFWPSTGAPHGTYGIKVHYYAACGGASGSVPFRVRTVVDGLAHTYSGSIGLRDTVAVASFTR